MPRVSFPSTPAADWVRGCLGYERVSFSGTGVPGEPYYFISTREVTVPTGEIFRGLCAVCEAHSEGEIVFGEFGLYIERGDGVIYRYLGPLVVIEGSPQAAIGVWEFVDLCLLPGEYTFQLSGRVIVEGAHTVSVQFDTIWYRIGR